MKAETRPIIWLLVTIIILTFLLYILTTKNKPKPSISNFANQDKNEYSPEIQALINSYKQYPAFNTEPVDRTKLYGSLFLENLDKAIKNMTDPELKYEKTSIKLNDYQDVIT